MQHKSKRDRRPTNPGTIVITWDGYLAGIPTNGPGRIMRAKLNELIFHDAVNLGWAVEVADFGRRGARVTR